MAKSAKNWYASNLTLDLFPKADFVEVAEAIWYWSVEPGMGESPLVSVDDSNKVIKNILESNEKEFNALCDSLETLLSSERWKSKFKLHKNECILEYIITGKRISFWPIINAPMSVWNLKLKLIVAQNSPEAL